MKKKVQQLIITFDGPELTGDQLADIARGLSIYGTVQGVTTNDVLATQSPPMASSQDKTALVVILEIQKYMRDHSFLENVEFILDVLSGGEAFLNEYKIWKKILDETDLSDPKDLRTYVHERGLDDSRIMYFGSKLEHCFVLAQERIFFEMISKLLFSLPEKNEYARLNLSKQMVESYLDFDRLIAQPQLVRGALKRAWDEYMKLYVGSYVKEYEVFQTALNQMHKERKGIEKALKACKKLDQISTLGPPMAHSIMAWWKSFFGEYQAGQYTKKEVEDEVRESGFYGNFVLGMEPPKKEFEMQKNVLRDILHQKFLIMQKKCVTQVLDNHDGNVGKLMNLIQLAKLEDIMDLLAVDDSGEVTLALEKMVSP